VLTALDLIRVVEVVGLGRITGLGLVRIRGLGLDRIQGRALVPTTVRGPIMALVSDHRAAPLALLRLPIIRLSNNESSATVVDFAKSNRGLPPDFL
jgi:hypothetical protein